MQRNFLVSKVCIGHILMNFSFFSSPTFVFVLGLLEALRLVDRF